MERLTNLLHLFLILILFSCNKGAGEFSISGIVRDDTFNTSLVGAEIALYKVPLASNTEQFIGSQTIAADGKYHFTVPRERIEKYILRITKQLYFPIEKTIYFSELKLKEENIFDLTTWAQSWVELKFVNQNPLSMDHFRYIKQAGYASCTTCCPITEQDFYGAVDTSIFCINKGNTIYSLLYWVLNTPNQGYLEANTTAFDTTQIYLNY
ncbi:MAG: hypothetical protein WCH03_08100 [Flavobacteriia bacterium]